MQHWVFAPSFVWHSVQISIGSGPCAEDFDDGSSDELGAVDGDIAVEECYVAAVDYVAKDIDELDLHEGETVCIIDGTANGIVICLLI